MEKGVRIKQGLPITSKLDDKDFILLDKNITGKERWIRAKDFIEEIISELPTSVGASSVTIDYDSIELNASWNFGNLDNKISTNANSVVHNATAKWHLSNLDLYNANLDATTSAKSLWDGLIDATDGSTMLMKIYDREDPSSYVFLYSETAISKQNGNTTPPVYYDIEFEAEVLSSSNITDSTIQNPTIVIIIGKMYDAVRNNTDTFTSVDKVEKVVTLTKAELAALPSQEANTLYITPKSDCSGGQDDISTNVFSYFIYDNNVSVKIRSELNSVDPYNKMFKFDNNYNLVHNPTVIEDEFFTKVGNNIILKDI